MENGFKVGDRVISMKVAHVKMANGKIGTVIALCGNYAIIKFDTEIERDGGGKSDTWYVEYKNMKLIEENPSIHIYPNEANTNETIAILKQGKEVIKAASTICNPADEYDFNKGAEIAFNRLLRVKETT